MNPKRLIGFVIGLVVVTLVVTVVLVFTIRDDGRIYPGVTVQGIDLGKLTVEEAVETLDAALPTPDERTLTVTAGERAWTLSWAMVGQGYDVAVTAQAAQELGRTGSRDEQRTTRARLRETGIELALTRVPADPDRVRDYVEQFAAQVYAPPLEARLTLDGTQVNAISGEPGRRLDIEASIAALEQALRDDAAQVELVLDPIPPQRTEPEPAALLAQALLAEPFVLVIDDPLTGDIEAGGYYTEFIAPPERVATWLSVVPLPTSIALDFDRAAIEAWLAEIAPQLGPERTLDVAEAARQIMVGPLAAGEHRFAATIRHPASTYVVQPGDNFYDIAYFHGFPQWKVEQANPGLEPGQIDAGQAITIPSIDVLFPYPLVPNKRIEIDLPEQRLLAYENDEVIFDLKVSSGISTAPTIAGQFQVLFKEEDAFARRWNLDMPYFMGIYEEGEGYHNGIHELPITSWGNRLSAGVLGWPASYGCIIVDEGSAKDLFEWTPVGTLVRITGVAPGTPSWQETLADIAPPVDGP